MIDSNVDQLSSQLKKIHEETIKKMENMVFGFITDTIVEPAVNLTPYGEINENTEGLYERRFDRYGWAIRPGLAKGGWKVRLETGYDASLSGSPVTYDTDNSGLVYDDPHGSQSKSYAANMAERYKLGQTIVVVNTTPYVAKSGINNGDSLESGYSKQAPNGIMDPLLATIMRSYQADLKRYFDAG